MTRWAVTKAEPLVDVLPQLIFIALLLHTRLWLVFLGGIKGRKAGNVAVREKGICLSVCGTSRAVFKLGLEQKSCSLGNAGPFLLGV